MLDDREDSFEKKYAIDEELEFKAKIMGSKLFAEWTAAKMSMNQEELENYVNQLIDISLTGNSYQKILDYVQENLKKSGVEFKNEELETVYLEKVESAKDKLRG